MKRRAFERLLHWVAEREKARRNKEAGNPFPFCDDDIINSYRFCNVVRMDDRVSRWLLDNWYKPNRGRKVQWFSCAVARYFNWPDTLEVIGYPNHFQPKRIIKRLSQIDGKVFSAAYIIPAPPGTRKIEHVINNVLTPLFEDGISFGNSMRHAHTSLVNRTGFGSFLAGQVVADMRHAWVWAKPPSDRMIWAPLGPGSIRGINRLVGREATQSVLPEAHDVMLEAFNKLRYRLDDPVVERMEMMDFQNCLCEFDKFMRVVEGQGKPKVRYVPGRGY